MNEAERAIKSRGLYRKFLLHIERRKFYDEIKRRTIIIFCLFFLFLSFTCLSIFDVIDPPNSLILCLALINMGYAWHSSAWENRNKKILFYDTDQR